MSYSKGFSFVLPTVLVFVCFLAGAAVQTYAMKSQELSVAYIIVLGLEAVLASAAGILLLKESFNIIKLAGTVLVIAGILLLKFSAR